VRNKSLVAHSEEEKTFSIQLHLEGARSASEGDIGSARGPPSALASAWVQDSVLRLDRMGVPAFFYKSSMFPAWKEKKVCRELL